MALLNCASSSCALAGFYLIGEVQWYSSATSFEAEKFPQLLARCHRPRWHRRSRSPPYRNRIIGARGSPATGFSCPFKNISNYTYSYIQKLLTKIGKAKWKILTRKNNKNYMEMVDLGHDSTKKSPFCISTLIFFDKFK